MYQHNGTDNSQQNSNTLIYIYAHNWTKILKRLNCGLSNLLTIGRGIIPTTTLTTSYQNSKGSNKPSQQRVNANKDFNLLLNISEVTIRTYTSGYFAPTGREAYTTNLPNYKNTIVTHTKCCWHNDHHEIGLKPCITAYHTQNIKTHSSASSTRFTHALNTKVSQWPEQQKLLSQSIFGHAIAQMLKQKSYTTSA
jgi:hypothetical protein